jgi:hypothetical protein
MIIIKSVKELIKYQNTGEHILTIFKNHTYFYKKTLGWYG